MTTVATPEAPGDEVLSLFAKHGTSLYRFSRSMLDEADEAEDVVQEVFLRLLQHLQAGGHRGNLRGWLFEVAANCCRDRLRRRRRWLPWRPELDQRSSPPESESRDLRLARAALRELAPRDRLLLSLRAQGLSYSEIARAAGIEPVSVGRLLSRAVDRWKKKVGA
jgi:RNA polymerase sigma-70 factor (ECF subfamily)